MDSLFQAAGRVSTDSRFTLDPKIDDEMPGLESTFQGMQLLHARRKSAYTLTYKKKRTR